jgi:hypothetical protein
MMMNIHAHAKGLQRAMKTQGPSYLDTLHSVGSRDIWIRVVPSSDANDNVDYLHPN